MKLSGYVHEDDGSWVSGAVVEAFLGSIGGSAEATTTSDGNGYWELDDLDPGAYVVRIAWGDSVRYRYPDVAWQTGGIYDVDGQVILQGSPGFVPSGAIMIWSGAIDDIPTGWVLCDGENGTPDLRNRFVVGAGSSYSVGDTGGADQVSLSVSQIPSHNHTCSTDGAHTHRARNMTGSGSTLGIGWTGLDYTNKTNAVEVGGSHTHTVGVTGSGHAHENRPPFYALAFIMKV